MGVAVSSSPSAAGIVAGVASSVQSRVYTHRPGRKGSKQRKRWRDTAGPTWSRSLGDIPGADSNPMGARMETNETTEAAGGIYRLDLFDEIANLVHDARLLAAYMVRLDKLQQKMATPDELDADTLDVSRLEKDQLLEVLGLFLGSHNHIHEVIQDAGAIYSRMPHNVKLAIDERPCTCPAHLAVQVAEA